MEILQISDFFKKAESDFPVDKWRIGAIHIWPLIRVSLFRRLFLDAYIPGKTASRRYAQGMPYFLSRLRESFSGWLKFSYAYCRDYKNNIRYNHKTFDAVFLSNGISYTFIDNAWQDNF